MTTLLTPAQLAAEWQVHPETVRRLLRAGALRAMRHGDTWRIHPDDAEAYRQAHTSGGEVVSESRAPQPAAAPARLAALPDLPADYAPVFPELWPDHAARPAAARGCSATKKKAALSCN